MLKVVTNNVPRLLEDKFIPEWGDTPSPSFMYKGERYFLDEFMYISPDSPFKGWDGYLSESFFSGVLVKFTPDDCNRVIVGWYVS